jgi:uncharacterized protein (TIGR02246 family)
MKTRMLFAVLITLASIGTFADTKSDIAALEAVDRAWAAAFNAADADALAASYDENAVLMPPAGIAITGRAAIREYLKKGSDGAMKAGMKYNLAPKPAGGAAGNVGWQSGTYTVTDKLGGVIERGKYLSVSTKKNGKWVYVRDTWNTDGAPPPATK